MAESNDRHPPQDLNAERAILGAILLNPGSLDRIREDGLSDLDFAQPGHRLIFQTVLHLADNGGGVDELTVCSELEQVGKLEQVGGYHYVSDLVSSVPSVANLGRYLAIVQDLSLKRQLLDAMGQIAEDVFAGEDDGKQSLEKIEGQLFELRSKGGGNSSLERLGDIAERVYEELRQRAESPNAVTGIPTGFRDLDKLLAGLQRSDLLIVAARPSMGKTAFSLNLLAHAAVRAGAATAFFSLEMGREQVATRMLTSESRVAGDRMRTGQLRNDDWQPLLQATETLDKASVYIDDTPGITVGEMRAKCRRLAGGPTGLDLVAVDYLQLMTGEDRNASREQEISAISRGLKGLAKELNIPVIALSQLNRGVEQRADKRPMMSDLRESGAIEQDADVIMFLYRDEYYNPGNPETQGMAEVLVRKQRNGSTGDVKLAWRGQYARFENLERDFS